MTTASLPMYGMTETRDAYDEFWAALAENLTQLGLTEVPDHLTHDRPVRELWSGPDLFISQCCGYDLIARYKNILRPVATPEYAVDGCLGANYCSTIVVAEDSPFTDVRQMTGTIAVINGPESHSGMSALRHLVSRGQKEGRFFTELKVSGSHIASLDTVRDGKADIAAIDSVTLSLLRRYRPESFKGLKVLGTTYAAPAPPFVVKASMPEEDVRRVRQALVATIEDPALTDCREQLLLKGLTIAEMEDYWVMEAFQDHAAKHGLSMV